MTALITFVVVALCISLVIMTLVLLRQTSASELNFDEQNLALYQARLRVLEQQAKAENLSAEQTAELKDELGLELLGQQKPSSQSQFELRGFGVSQQIVWSLVLIVFALGLYLSAFGGIERLRLMSQLQDKAGEAEQFLSGAISEPSTQTLSDPTGEQLEHLIAAMQQQVHSNPDQAGSWVSLSQAYLAIGDAPAAVIALKRALRLAPENPNHLLLLAQTQLFSQGAIEPDYLVQLQNGLRQTPDHEGMLMLLLAEAVKSKQTEQANTYLAQMKALVRAKPGDRTLALQSLDKLAQTLDAPASSGLSINAELALSERAQVVVMSWPDTASLFIYAVEPTGGAPYAVKRLRLGSIKAALMQGNLRLSLSDDDAMLESRTLSSAKNAMIPLVFRARLSLSNSSEPLASDLSAQKSVATPLLSRDSAVIKLILDSPESPNS